VHAGCSPSPPKYGPSSGGIPTPPDVFLGPPESILHTRNGSSIASAVFVGLTVVINRHTDTRTPVAAGGGRRGRGMRPGRHCAGAAFGGAKIWNSETWSFLAKWRSHCRTDSAGSLHYVITPPNLTPHQRHRCKFHKNIDCRSDWRGRQHRRLPRAAKHPRAASDGHRPRYVCTNRPHLMLRIEMPPNM